MKSKFFFFVSRPSTPQKFHDFIFDLLAFSGKIFLREKISTRFLSPFCILLFFLFQKHFFGNFLLWTDWNFSSPWENGLHFGTSLLPGRMVYILELLFSLGEKSFTRRIWRDFPKFFILSSLIKTLFSLGEWFTFWNFSSPWENGSVFQLASIFLPKSMVSLEIYVWGYVKKATRKQRFATCVDIDFVPVFLNFGQVLF